MGTMIIESSGAFQYWFLKMEIDDDIKNSNARMSVGADIRMVPKRGKVGRPGSRQRFQNQLSFALTAATLLLLGVLSLLFGDSRYPSSSSDVSGELVTESVSRLLENVAKDVANENNGGDYSHFSCSYIYDKVSEPDDICIFAKTCNDGEGVWAPWVFCTSAFSTYSAFAILSPFAVLWMVILFRLLGSTAEDFFSCSLEMFSLQLGLPPRFAGVTLLALGNGAADVSATISAIVSDEENGYKLSLGALTGAAMLVGGVVSGVVVLVADGVKCRGALIRDVGALMVTIAIVWNSLLDGVVTRSTTTMFFGLYAFFVCSVLAADVYHRTIVVPRLAAVGAALSEAEQNITGTPESPPDESSPTYQPNTLTRIITSISNYDNTCVMMVAPNTSLSPEQQMEHDVTSRVTSSVIGEMDSTEPLQEHENPILSHGRNRIHADESTSNGYPTTNLEMDIDDNGGDYTLVEDHMDHICIAEASPGIQSHNWIGAYKDGKQEIFAEVYALWEEISLNEGELKLYERFLMLCELPFTMIRKASIPIPCEGYYNRGFVALSVGLSPFWMTYYLLVQHGIEVWSKEFFLFAMTYHGVSILTAVLILRFAPAGEGHMSLIIATPIAFYGFVMAATWIDWIADRLVSLLNFIGIVLHIPGAVMGLTILAWGNSVGDLSANITMARKGLANMAMTACFAGPVFNILLGLGLGFRSLEAQTNKDHSAVSLSSPILAGFVFIVLNCVMILSFGIFVGKGQIESNYGYAAVSLYAIYVITSITLEFQS